MPGTARALGAKVVSEGVENTGHATASKRGPATLPGATVSPDPSGSATTLLASKTLCLYDAVNRAWPGSRRLERVGAGRLSACGAKGPSSFCPGSAVCSMNVAAVYSP